VTRPESTVERVLRSAPTLRGLWSVRTAIRYARQLHGLPQ